jgi:hypothetical protein
MSHHVLDAICTEPGELIAKPLQVPKCGLAHRVDVERKPIRGEGAAVGFERHDVCFVRQIDMVGVVAARE